MLDQEKDGSVHQITVSCKLGCPSLGNGEHNWLCPWLGLFLSVLLKSGSCLTRAGTNREKRPWCRKAFLLLPPEINGATYPWTAKISQGFLEGLLCVRARLPVWEKVGTNGVLVRTNGIPGALDWNHLPIWAARALIQSSKGGWRRWEPSLVL